MASIPSHFRRDWRPVADPDAVITAGNARFTVLTSRLIRLEWSPDRQFEDRPSQPFWYRRQPVPAFTVQQAGDTLTLESSHLLLRYDATADGSDGFTAASLQITLLDDDTIWRPGLPDRGNLRGTTRTLDEVSGATALEPGLLSRDGWVCVDDSNTLVFNAAGWLEPRAPGRSDWYFFGYGRDYNATLRDYHRLAGAVPMLPRWALGNWWSRYWDYSDRDLQALIADFRAHNVPLSVCIIDMDWHLVDVGSGVNGWTGYTWNRDLFPHPERFLAWLHGQGLRTALNLHPALGVRPYEDAYPAMARRLSVDPAAGETIPFDIADPAFARAYFAELHHPLEAQGVDFWWIDWQQGEDTRLPGLDPLWWLNHLHFYDLGRRPNRRPFIFSRWGGLGNHRYPIGFSGDTHVTWETLAFQPHFTATAANVGYGWWSHDIGGHMFGVEEPELYARWVQYGLFSPILRLHSTKNPFHERRPFAYDAEILRVTRDAMQLRHAFIPLLYSLAWQNHTTGSAPIRPLYHDYPERDEAYACPQQYTFGDDLIAAPFTTPAAPDTRLSRQVVWLPPGDWYDFFSGEPFTGDAWHAIYGGLDRIPVFARAGAIVPLGPKAGWGGVDNPEVLDVHLFAGANGRFQLYEDDGVSQEFLDGAFALTAFEQEWHSDELIVRVTAVKGDRAQVPAVRRLRFHVHGVLAPRIVALRIDGRDFLCHCTHDSDHARLLVDEIALPSAEALELRFGRGDGLLARRDTTTEQLLALLHAFKLDTYAKAALAEQAHLIPTHPELLSAFAVDLTPGQLRALLEVALGAGGHHVPDLGAPHRLVFWNNHGRAATGYRFTQTRPTWRREERFQSEVGPLPRFRGITIPAGVQWEASITYGNLVTVGLNADT